jgi:hypothetical protein
VKGVFAIDEPAGPRFELALDQLRDGLGFRFNDVWFRLDGPATLCCEAVDHGSLRPTDAAVRAHIARAKSSFATLCEASRLLNDIAERRALRFAVIQDLGNGTMEVCRESNGSLEWSKS